MSNEDAAQSLPSPASEPCSTDANQKHSYLQSYATSPSPTGDAPTSSIGARQQSAPRVLNPAPIATKIVPSPITATASPGFDSAYPSPTGGGPGIGGGSGAGPTSGSYVIPPRPKPGRKPATDEPASKRKAQNRESQRAFRARKAAKLNEMKTQAEIAEARHRQELQVREMHIAEQDQRISEQEQRIRQLEAINEQMREEHRRAVGERDEWMDKAVRLDAVVKRYTKADDPLSTSARAVWENDLPSLSTFTVLDDTHNAYETPKSKLPATFKGACFTCKATSGQCTCTVTVTNQADAVTPADFRALKDALRVSPPPRLGPFDVRVFEEESFADREIDFTAQFATKRTRVEPQAEGRPDTRPSIAFLTQQTNAEAGCGFCTAESYCVCRDTSIQDLQGGQEESSWGTTAASNQTQVEAPPPAAAPATSGPGSCADCQRDPKQRAWCQRVAQLKSSSSSSFSRSSPSPSPLTPSTQSGLSTMEPRAHYASVPLRRPTASSPLASPPTEGGDTHMPDAPSIGCSDAFKLFNGRVPVDRDMDWSTLRPIRPDTTRERLPGIDSATGGAANTRTGSGTRTYSALELDTAGVIATLQHSMIPLEPRKEDGKHAELVRIAEEWRRERGASEKGE